MPTPSTEARAFALLRELIDEWSVSAPGRLSELLAALDPAVGDGLASSLAAVRDWIHQVEIGGPRRWQELFETLAAWSAMQIESPEGIRPVLDAFAALVTEAVLGEESPLSLDEVVMPALERLSVACVDAIMGERS